MKILLTGSTGTIGSEILSHCLSHPSITSLILLVRRPVPNLDLEKNPKVRVILMKDFNVYPEEVLEEIVGCEACIWAMGTYTGDPVVEVQYPTAFANAFLQGSRKRERKEKFRFVFLRGAYTVEDQERSLWFMPTARRGNGLGEKILRLFPQENNCADFWETYIMKPGGILPSSVLTSANFILRPFMDLIGAIRSDEVAACIIDIAIHGSEVRKYVWQNSDMVTKGRAVLGR